MNEEPKKSKCEENPTLIINRSDSMCGNCGKGCDPQEKNHDTVLGWSEEERKKNGCGIKWKFVASHYGDYCKAPALSMRPDLKWTDDFSSHYPKAPPQPQKQLSECKYKIGDRVEYSYSQPALSCFMHGKVKGNGIIVRLAKPSEHGRGKSAKVFVMDNGALVHENEIIPPESPKPYQLNKCRCKKGTYLNWFCPKHSPARMSVFEQQNLESPKPSQPEKCEHKGGAGWGIKNGSSYANCIKCGKEYPTTLLQPESQFTGEDRELLKNWPEKLIFKLGGTEGLPEGWKPQGFSSVSVLICDLLAAKDREAEERVRKAKEELKNKIHTSTDSLMILRDQMETQTVEKAVKKERERCLKILFENWASENAPNNYSQIKLAILNPPKE